MKKAIALILVMVMALSLIACGKKEEPKPAEIAFTVVVTDLEGNEKTFNYSSNAESVGAALVTAGLVSGSDSEYGLMVDTVDGITADWDKDQTYWAFYINGEYAMTGVDSTPIEADAVYGFTLTKG